MKSKLDPALLALMAVALVALPFVASGYVIYVVNLLMVFVVLALGLHLVIGETGQFALSHAAFYGVGIYTAGLINNLWHPPFFVSIVAGGLLAAVLGYIIGALALRMRDIYLALSTFAFGEAMQWVFLNWQSVTNGSNGFRISPATLFGYELVSDIKAYPFVVAIAALLLWATIALSRSQLGSAFRAVRESDVAAQAMGVNVNAIKRTAFTLSAAYAGIAGGMYTTFASFIHPESLGFQTTILILTMVVVGGIGSVRGAIAGALGFGLISELLRQALSFQEIIYGVILMGFMMFAPKGLFASRDARRRAPPPAAPLPTPNPRKGAPHERPALSRRPGPDGEVRRPDGHQRPVHAGGTRPHPCADRSQRRRQVHHLQLRLALLPPHPGPHRVRRRRHHDEKAARNGRTGRGAHFPEP